MDENVIKSEIEQGVAQVDKSLTVDDFVMNYNSKNRKLTVSFTAKSSSGKSLGVSNTW